MRSKETFKDVLEKALRENAALKEALKQRDEKIKILMSAIDGDIKILEAIKKIE